MKAAPARPSSAGGGPFTTALLAATLAVLGLLTGLPFLLGPVIGVVAVVGAAGWRHTSRGRTESALFPVLGALGALLFAAPPERSTELFGGVAALAFLLWLADDPARPAGGGRRAVPLLGVAALSFGLSWSVTLLLAPGVPEVGIAAGLLVAALFLVAVALRWSLSAPRSEAA